MKNFKKFAAMVSALTLAACAVAPVASLNAFADANTLTIIGGVSGHTYSAFRIFDGTTDDSGLNGTGGVLNSASLATGWEELPAALKAISTNATITEGNPYHALGQAFSAVTNVNDILNVLNDNTDADFVKAFSQFVGEYAINNSGINAVATNDGATMTINDDGYYVIVDTTSASNNVTAYLLGVYDKETGGLITIKNAAPTFDKLVQDEIGDADANADVNGWGETADHAIGEEFQFKLVATLPADQQFKEYSHYKLVFNDTLESGVDYVATPTTEGYANTVKAYVDDLDLEISLEIIPAVSDKKLTWTIDDLLMNSTIKSNLGDKAIKVEVVYTAKLNANATMAATEDSAIYNANEGGSSTANENTAYIEYSSNPNWSGNGVGKPDGSDEDNDTEESEKDTVGVYAYQFTVHKVGEDADANGLAGAEFQLKSGGTPLALVNIGNGMYRVPVDETETTTTTLVSPSNGKIVVKGLDTGSYVLTETKAPSPYKTPSGVNADTTITIDATHVENSDGTVSVTLKGNAVQATEIVNSTTAQLPSTGGIGTTLFYLGGGTMVAVAGVFLITKKRMGKKED